MAIAPVFYQSSVGKKVIMAVTGLILLSFVIGHLLGNLTIFFGPDALNAYAEKLRHMAPILWAVRLFLLAAVAAHIWSAILLAIENKRARPIPYLRSASIQTTYQARTMVFSGTIIFAFLVYHLLHFTFRVTNPEISHIVDGDGRHDVFSMVVASFQNLYISAVYLIAMFLLCFHLGHGIPSLFQSAGLNDETWELRLKRAGNCLAWLLFLGYASIPLSVFAGWINLQGGIAS